MNARPPTKQGIGPSSVALPPGHWTTTLDFLAQRFPGIPRAEWIARIERGDVLDAQCAPIKIDTPYRVQSKLYYYKSAENEPVIPFREVVLFQDDYLVVADKPHFLPVLSTGRYVKESLLVRLKQKLNLDALVPLHRIDRDTAGIVLFAVQPATRRRYMDLFRRRAITKFYEAVAPYRTGLKFPITYRDRLEAGDHFMQVHAVPGKPNTESLINLLEVRGTLARYAITPITGKRHQIRAHMTALGIPIVNDRIYPQLRPAAKTAGELAAEFAEPLQLLAKRVEFIDPISGLERRFESAHSLRW